MWHDPAEGMSGPDTGVTAWPEHACCCAAPPLVKVLVPGEDERLVDLFLCGHHYRACLGPLALADGRAVFRTPVSVLSLAGR
ncbi:hypothetical protein [Streptomyces sediminimaris]|uniref:hypothetical protein n=1 Tax=Streptomyces sediminimaris TaxID=3383721 RepID=UPI00399AC95D